MLQAFIKSREEEMQEADILKTKWIMELGITPIQKGELKSWPIHSSSLLHSEENVNAKVVILQYSADNKSKPREL